VVGGGFRQERVDLLGMRPVDLTVGHVFQATPGLDRRGTRTALKYIGRDPKIPPDVLQSPVGARRCYRFGNVSTWSVVIGTRILNE
jgi:hypothetical protein